MAKIPVILEPGRADGKLATSGAIFDENKGMFQSELNDIQDTLNSDNPNKPLSAKQGKALKELLDTKVIEAGSVPIDTEPIEGNNDHLVTSDGIFKVINKEQTERINDIHKLNKYIECTTISINNVEYKDIYPKDVNIDAFKKGLNIQVDVLSTTTNAILYANIKESWTTLGIKSEASNIINIILDKDCDYIRVIAQNQGMLSANITITGICTVYTKQHIIFGCLATKPFNLIFSNIEGSDPHEFADITSNSNDYFIWNNNYIFIKDAINFSHVPYSYAAIYIIIDSTTFKYIRTECISLANNDKPLYLNDSELAYLVCAFRQNNILYQNYNNFSKDIANIKTDIANINNNLSYVIEDLLQDVTFDHSYWRYKDDIEPTPYSQCNSCIINLENYKNKLIEVLCGNIDQEKWTWLVLDDNTSHDIDEYTIKSIKNKDNSITRILHIPDNANKLKFSYNFSNIKGYVICYKTIINTLFNNMIELEEHINLLEKEYDYEKLYNTTWLMDNKVNDTDFSVAQLSDTLIYNTNLIKPGIISAVALQPASGIVKIYKFNVTTKEYVLIKETNTSTSVYNNIYNFDSDIVLNDNEVIAIGGTIKYKNSQGSMISGSYNFVTKEIVNTTGKYIAYGVQYKEHFSDFLNNRFNIADSNLISLHSMFITSRYEFDIVCSDITGNDPYEKCNINLTQTRNYILFNNYYEELNKHFPITDVPYSYGCIGVILDRNTKKYKKIISFSLANDIKPLVLDKDEIMLPIFAINHGKIVWSCYNNRSDYNDIIKNQNIAISNIQKSLSNIIESLLNDVTFDHSYWAKASDTEPTPYPQCNSCVLDMTKCRNKSMTIRCGNTDGSVWTWFVLEDGTVEDIRNYTISQTSDSAPIRQVLIPNTAKELRYSYNSYNVDGFVIIEGDLIHAINNRLQKLETEIDANTVIITEKQTGGVYDGIYETTNIAPEAYLQRVAWSIPTGIKLNKVNCIKYLVKIAGTTTFYKVITNNNHATAVKLFEYVDTNEEIETVKTVFFDDIVLKDNEYIGISARFAYNNITNYYDAYITIPEGTFNPYNGQKLYYALYYKTNINISINNINEKIQNLENKQLPKETIVPFIIPPAIYTVCNDISFNKGTMYEDKAMNTRNYSLKLYIDHMFRNWTKRYNIHIEGGTNFLPFYSKINGYDNYINTSTANTTKDVNITNTPLKIIGNEINDLELNISHISTRNLITQHNKVRLLCIGDSVTEGALGDINKSYSTAPGPYWQWIKALFEMDKLEKGSDFDYESLGNIIGKSWSGKTFDLKYSGFDKSNILACACGVGGSRTSDWLNPKLNNGQVNPFYNPSTNKFSLAYWVNNYRTLIINSDNTTTRCDSSNKGPLAPDNTLLYNVCEPTHVLIQLGYNQQYNSTGSSRTTYLENLQTIINTIHQEYPNIYILLSLPDTAGTYFPNLFPDYFGQGDDIYNLDFLKNDSHTNFAYMNKDLIDMQNTENRLYYCPSYFASPLCYGAAYRESNELAYYSENKEGFAHRVHCGALPNLHPNNAAHANWAYQIYSLIKYTLTL